MLLFAFLSSFAPIDFRRVCECVSVCTHAGRKKRNAASMTEKSMDHTCDRKEEEEGESEIEGEGRKGEKEKNETEEEEEKRKKEEEITFSERREKEKSRQPGKQ